jgi:hypothetical protein
VCGDCTADNCICAAICAVCAGAAIEAARKRIEENTTFTALQSQAADEAAARARVQAIVDALDLDGVTAVVNDSTLSDNFFSAAFNGTPTATTGTGGTYRFTVTLTKGPGAQVVTAELTMEITAIPYDPAGAEKAVKDAKDAVEETFADLSVAQTVAYDEAAALAEINRIITGLNLIDSYVAAEVNKTGFQEAVNGIPKGDINGTAGHYKFTVTLSRTAAEPADTIELTLNITPVPYDGCTCGSPDCDDCRIGAGWGDVDGDGRVDSADVTMLRRFIAEVPEATQDDIDTWRDKYGFIIENTRVNDKPCENCEDVRNPDCKDCGPDRIPNAFDVAALRMMTRDAAN